MRRIVSRNVVVAVLVLFSTLPILGAEDALHSVRMPEGPPLSFLQPTAWNVETEEAGPSVTVRLSPASGSDFVMLMTIFPFQPDSPIASAEGLRAAVLEIGQQKLSVALQDSIELTEVRGRGAVGYLYHLTDRNPERGPGDYREANQGMMLLAPYVASVTVLTHSGDADTVREAISLLETLGVETEP